jgi:hypothetical protein
MDAAAHLPPQHEELSERGILYLKSALRLGEVSTVRKRQNRAIIAADVK